MKKENAILLWGYVSLLLIACGCLTAKNLPKHNDKFPLAAATYAAEKFPCVTGDTITITKIDSTNFNNSVSGLDDWFGESEKGADSVVKVIEIDSSCVKYKSSISKLLEQIQDARARLAKLPPVIIHDEKLVKVFDSARYTVVSLQLSQEQEINKVLSNQFQDTKDKLNWWRLAAIITWCIVGLLIGVRLYGIKSIV